MKKIDTYIKCISLLYNESQLEKEQLNNKEFVKELIKVIKPNKKSFFGGVSSVEDRLVEIILELIGLDYPIPEEMLKETIELSLKEDESIQKIAKSAIFKPFKSNKDRLEYVRMLKLLLNRRINEIKLKNDINKTVMRMNTDGNIDIYGVATELKRIINDVTVNNSVGIPSSFMEPIDIGNEDAVAEIIEEDVNTDGSNRLQTGWQSVNRMLNGGFIRGESVALLFKQNDYKSSLSRTLVAQVAMFNKPVMLDPTKKPLLCIITLEDSVLEVLTFLYKYLYADEHGKLPTGKDKNKAFLAKYVKEKLSVNGYHVKIIKGTATKSTFSDIEQTVQHLESQGYEIHMLVVDYLSKLNVSDMTGYNSATIYANLWEHFKDLVAPRKIVGISPHQASAEMSDLLKSGIKGIDVVKEMQGKNYFQHSKAINQVVDLTIIGHRAKYNREWVLTLQRDRRRYPEIIDDEDTYVVLPFPKKIPIGSDLNKKDISIQVDSGYDEENE